MDIASNTTDWASEAPPHYYMKVIIDPAWSLGRTIEAAFDAYTGSGKSSRGFRMSVLMAWANIVGRQRATSELQALRDQLGGWSALAEMLGVGTSTLRGVRRHFDAVPDHVILPSPPPEGGDDMTTLEGFTHLGNGGYGDVWRARDALGRNVAVKYMTSPTSEAQRVTLAHATPLALLGNHPNIVSVYYCNYLVHPRSGKHVPAIVMEFIEGETLRQRLMRPIDLREVVTIGDALCNAIIFIHGKGLTHSDLHEDNIMISPNGHLKVIDLMNDRRLSELTSGARRRGEVDDVESLKALLRGALGKATDQTEVLNQFESGVQGIRHAVGVREVLSQLLPRKRSISAVSGLPAFLATWNQIERNLRGLADQPAEGRFIPVPALVERIYLSVEDRRELQDLSRLRNRAVHGELDLIDSQALERAVVIGEKLREFMEAKADLGIQTSGAPNRKT